MTALEQLAALRAKAEKATPRPWERDLTYQWPSKVRSKDPRHENRWVVDVPSAPSTEYTLDDAAFIAVANPAAIIALDEDVRAELAAKDAEIAFLEDVIEMSDVPEGAWNTARARAAMKENTDD